MFKHLKLPVLALVWLVLSALPALAFAGDGGGVARPPEGSDWNLFVYGNGRVIYDILMSIKMLMVPNAGDSGFTTLLLLLATIGFVVLAISAGFDPGKNLLRMFTYILVVWGVTFGTTKLTADVVIIDLARAAETRAQAADYRVTGAPALVVLPAAMTSLIGKYFTERIEAYFTLPGELKLSGTTVGQFNLFGKMMQEANQYVITSPELKKSLSTYVANCIVPALAMGKITGPGKTPSGSTTPNMLYGTEALLRTTNIMETLGSAASRSVLTKYYPYNLTNTGWIELAGTEVAGLQTDTTSVNQYRANGILVSCTTAYAAISKDVENNAALLLQQGADAWSKAGVMVLFEDQFKTVLGQASVGTQASGFSTPSGFIMQQSLINAMNGTYRQAAMQTGNNEMLQAAALTQAEVSQKSAWASSFSVFNNMMGYVFTVLQAFIFAITPLIIVALMIPGMGRSIFVNYAQILVWLTLWQPMLSIINYIITLFGSESMSGVISAEGGISPANTGIIAERTNDLMIAAQFLGTMTPLLSWGIVKGAMAFTEFISQGVGSSFASQAGAAAATGNLAMNNMTLANTSLDKFSTMMSSQVGTQAVSVGANAGAMLVNQDGGGSAAAVNGSQANLAVQKQNMMSSAIGHSEQVAAAVQALSNRGYTKSDLLSIKANTELSSALREAADKVAATDTTLGKKKSAGETESATEQAGAGEGARRDASRAASSNFKASGEVTYQPPGLVRALSPASAKLTVGGGAGAEQRVGEALDKSAQKQETATKQFQSELDGHDKKQSAKTGLSATDTKSLQRSSGSGKSASSDEQLQVQKAIQDTLSRQNSYTKSLQETDSIMRSMNYNDGNSLAELSNQIRQLEAMSAQMSGDMNSVRAGYEALGGQLAGRSATYEQEIGDARTRIEGARQALMDGATQFAPNTAAVRATVAADMKTMESGLDAQQKKAAERTTEIKAEADRRVAAGPRIENVLNPLGNGVPTAPHKDHKPTESVMDKLGGGGGADHIPAKWRMGS